MPTPSYGEISALEVSPLGDDDVIKYSVVDVISQDTFANDKIPKPGGVTNGRLGTIDYTYICETCKCNKNLCPGHMGKLDLNIATISPAANTIVIKYLRIICHTCYELIDPNVILSKTTTSTRVCKNCGNENPKILDSDASLINVLYPGATASTSLWPSQIKHILEGIRPETLKKLGVRQESHPKKFIITKLAISSVVTRPDVKQIGGNRSSNDAQTVFYHLAVAHNSKIPKFITPPVAPATLKECMLLWYVIEGCIKDNPKAEVSLSMGTPMGDKNGEKSALLKKFSSKNGEIRHHILSKTHVNVARTVIVGDPTIPIDSLVIPLEFAKIIQIKEKVQSYNIELMNTYLQNAFNGVYPACTSITKGGTKQVYTIKKDKVVLEIGDIIHRDVVDGDWALYNRQPTLFYVSAMKHNIIVSKDPNSKTFKMNETACTPYAADFDGDEMNLIFAANMVGMADFMIMSCMPRFFNGYQNCSPHLVNIKDAILGIFMLTKSGVVLPKHQAMKLFANTSTKPDFDPNKQEYTGRELVSKILPKINYIGNSNYYDENLAPYIDYKEDEKKIVIKQGKLISGVLDKKMNSIYQIICAEYGTRIAMTTMFNIQQIALAYLTIRGFSVGIRDLLISSEAEQEIRRTTDLVLAESQLLTDRLLYNNIIPPLGQTVQDFYESEQNAILSNDYVTPIMNGIDPDNSILALAMCGSTGNLTIIKQIIASYGQRNIGSKRLPQMMSYKRTNPFFPRFDTSPQSRGFIGEALRHGMKPSAFVGGAQESRIAIINKTMLTATTGSQSRTNIKNLEDILVTNIGVCENAKFIIEQAFGDTNFDPRNIEHVKFPSVILNDVDFEKQYNHDPIEFAQLKADREVYRKIFLSIERLATDQKFNNSQLLPVNTQRIFDDIRFSLYGLEDEKDPEPYKSLENMRSTVKSFCQSIPYTFFNDGWEKKKGYVAPYFKSAVKLLCINIRSILYTENLKLINETVLASILMKIKSKIIESILEYGTSIGIITAMSISEPSTQLVLHSIRADVRARVSKKSPIQAFKEIIGIVNSTKALDPKMWMRLKSGSSLDKAREITNYIEMVKFKDFVVQSQVFSEKYGEIIHEDYIHEKDIIKSFEKILTNAPPSDLIKFCIRFELDMYSMVLKNITIDQIIFSLYKVNPYLHIVYTSDNDKTGLVIRVYVRAMANIATLKGMSELEETLLEEIVRGVQGVISAYVDTESINTIKPDGSVGPESVITIKTNGVNLMGIFSLQNQFPEIDYTTLQTDNIKEVEDMFGIAAAKGQIISEIRNILGGLYYGHYNLIASLMTVTGKCTPMTLSGPEKRHANTLLKMADCKPIRVLEKLLTHGEIIPIDGISPKLMVGDIPSIGSYYNSVMINRAFVKEHAVTLSNVLDEI